MFAFENSCAEPVHVMPWGHVAAFTSQSSKQVRDPSVPRHVSPAAQCLVSHDWPTVAVPIATQPAVPSSLTTAHVEPEGHDPVAPPLRSSQPRTGTQTGTSKVCAATGWMSQKAVVVTLPFLVASLQVESPAQQ
jgi:hypothetical protein